MSSDTQAATSSVNYLTLTFAVFGGAAAWLLRLILNSSLVEWSCAIDATWPLWATAALATLVATAALVIALRYHRLASDAPHNDAARWLAFTGILFNITAITGIVLETAPVLVLDVCRAAA